MQQQPKKQYNTTPAQVTQILFWPYVNLEKKTHGPSILLENVQAFHTSNSQLISKKKGGGWHWVFFFIDWLLDMLNFSKGKKRKKRGRENDREGSRKSNPEEEEVEVEKKRSGTCGSFGRLLKCGIIATKDVHKMNEMNFSFSVSSTHPQCSSQQPAAEPQSRWCAQVEHKRRRRANHLFPSTTTGRLNSLLSDSESHHWKKRPFSLLLVRSSPKFVSTFVSLPRVSHLSAAQEN